MLRRVWLVLIGWWQRTAPVVQPPKAMAMPRFEPTVVEEMRPAAETEFQMRKVAGSGNVQVGHAGGDVSSSQVTNNHVTVHHHIYGQAAVAEPVSEAKKPTERPASTATDEQKKVLSLMSLLNDETRYKVLDFMRKEFKTGLVIKLEPFEVYRVHKYLDKVLAEIADAKTRQVNGKRAA